MSTIRIYIVLVSTIVFTFVYTAEAYPLTSESKNVEECKYGFLKEVHPHSPPHQNPHHYRHHHHHHKHLHQSKSGHRICMKGMYSQVSNKRGWWVKIHPPPFLLHKI